MTAPASPAAAEHLLLAVRDGAARITLNRPERMNAFAGTMRADLLSALEQVAGDREVRVVVIVGAGRAFSTGADIEVMAGLLASRDEATFAGFVETGGRVVRQLRSMPQPVVAALNGPAAGAGAALAAACDLRIASGHGSLGFTFARIGLHPDWGASFFLPRLVGAGRAAELFFSGRMVPADEAERIGLVNQVVPSADFAAAVEALSRALAAKPPLALAALKRSFAAGGVELDDALRRESEAQLALFRSRDVAEGVAAFREKRTPGYLGA